MDDMKPPAPPPLYRVSLEGAALWRDGKMAVVSIKVDGVWLRILAADVAGMFHAEQSAHGLRGAVEAGLSAAGLHRSCHRTPDGKTRRTRGDHAQTRKAALNDR
jgi:hypothetical protein